MQTKNHSLPWRSSAFDQKPSEGRKKISLSTSDSTAINLHLLDEAFAELPLEINEEAPSPGVTPDSLNDTWQQRQLLREATQQLQALDHQRDQIQNMITRLNEIE